VGFAVASHQRRQPDNTETGKKHRKRANLANLHFIECSATTSREDTTLIAKFCVVPANIMNNYLILNLLSAFLIEGLPTSLAST